MQLGVTPFLACSVGQTPDFVTNHRRRHPVVPFTGANNGRPDRAGLVSLHFQVEWTSFCPRLQSSPGCVTGVIAMQLRRTQCHVVNLSASIAQNVTDETPSAFFRKRPTKPGGSLIRKERRMGWGSGSGEYLPGGGSHR